MRRPYLVMKVFIKKLMTLYLTCSENFKQLIAWMGNFHMATLEHYIGKYIRESRMEESSIETKVPGQK